MICLFVFTLEPKLLCCCCSSHLSRHSSLEPTVRRLLTLKSSVFPWCLNYPSRSLGYRLCLQILLEDMETSLSRNDNLHGSTHDREVCTSRTDPLMNESKVRRFMISGRRCWNIFVQENPQLSLERLTWEISTCPVSSVVTAVPVLSFPRWCECSTPRARLHPVHLIKYGLEAIMLMVAPSLVLCNPLLAPPPL